MVAEAILSSPSTAVEMTAQQLADHVGVSRASVIRTAQSLGYAGFPQFRVALAQEQAAGAAASGPAPAGDSAAAAMRRNVGQFASRLEASFAALDERALGQAVETLDAATRVLVVANGFSAPVGLDFAQRLISAGRSAEWHTDAMAQRIAAHHLGEGAACFVFSGSGMNKTSIEAAEQARGSGAAVFAVTSFSSSPLASTSDGVLLVPQINPSFQEELTHTSRAALMLLNEQLVELLLARRGKQGEDARLAALTLIGDSLES